MDELWRIIEAVLRETRDESKIPSGALPKLGEKLTVLERIMGEEYYMFVQLKTLKLMVKEIASSITSI